MTLVHQNDAGAIRAFHGQTADMIRNAAAMGMRVRFADNGQIVNAASASPEFHRQLRDILGPHARDYAVRNGVAVAADGYSLQTDAHTRQMMAGLPPQVLERAVAVFERERLDDRALAAGIRADAGDTRSVVFFGAWHGQGNRDLDELLAGRGGTPRRVDLYGSEAFRGTRADRGERSADPPEVLYMVRERTAFATANAPPDLARRLGAAPPASLVPDAPYAAPADNNGWARTAPAAPAMR